MNETQQNCMDDDYMLSRIPCGSAVNLKEQLYQKTNIFLSGLTPENQKLFTEIDNLSLQIQGEELINVVNYFRQAVFA